MTIIPFGVTGCGKSTIAKLLTEKLGWQFYDADHFHSAENIKKMDDGEALTDQDRSKWLADLEMLIANSVLDHENNTLACSALKLSYRQYLRVNENVKFVFLEIGIAEVKARFEKRNAELIAAGKPPHFMNSTLIESQFATLETSGAIDLTLDATLPAEILVQKIMATFQLRKSV